MIDRLHVPLHGDDRPGREGGTDDQEDGKRRGPSQATELVKLARQRYRVGRTTTGNPFAVHLKGPNVALMLRGGRTSLRAELASAFAEEHGKVPSASALADSMLVLEGEALHAAQEDVALRVARHGDGLVLDLGDETGKAVVIEPGRWRVESRSPVVFTRARATASLPEPVRGGSLAELQNLLNVDESAWPLLVGWLVASLFPEIPHVILLLIGEQGTAKSTAQRLLGATVDPSSAQLRTAPRDVEDWVVAAAASWVVALDNASSITDWFSDALCRSSTGDGMVRRALYTDSDVSVISFRRVVTVSTIALAGALRGDLARRLLVVDLEKIPDRERKQEAEVVGTFTEAHPRILGALLDLVAKVLTVLPTVRLESLPPMADWARILDALDKVNGTKSLDNYLGQGQRLATEVVDSDVVAAAVKAHVEATKGWEGTAGALLELLRPDRAKDWPSSPRGMGGVLHRMAPALRQLGFTIDYTQKGRKWRLASPEREGETPSQPFQPLLDTPDLPVSGNGRDEQPAPATTSTVTSSSAGNGREDPRSRSESPTVPEPQASDQHEYTEGHGWNGRHGSFPYPSSDDQPTGYCSRCTLRTGLVDGEGRWRCSRCRVAEEAVS